MNIFRIMYLPVINLLVFISIIPVPLTFVYYKGLPVQMKTAVQYDSKLTDPFFKTEKSSYYWWIIEHDDGTFEDTSGEFKKGDKPPRIRHTANCVTKHQGKHTIRYCDATLHPDNTIELFIHDTTASTYDNLSVRIKDGVFQCQYWTKYVRDRGDEGVIWTTKKQKLILNKKKYHTGDIIKGKISFECLQEVTNPKYGGRCPWTIRVEGVFKPTLK